MNVITGYFSTFKVIQAHILSQDHVKVRQIHQNVCSVIYHKYAKYKNDKPNGYWNITGKDRFWGFVVHALGDGLITQIGYSIIQSLEYGISSKTMNSLDLTYSLVSQTKPLNVIKR